MTAAGQGAGPPPFVATPGSGAAIQRARSDRFPVLYRLFRAASAVVLHRFFDLRVAGLHHLPSRGPYIVAANHHNYLDGVVLGVALPRRIVFLVMPGVYRATLLHPVFHRHIGSIPLNVRRPGPGAIKRSLHVLEGGGVVGIFPEGPFSREGRLVPGQPGVAMIALRSGAPVVPAAIRGTYEALRNRRWGLPRRYPLSVRFGRPIEPLSARPGPGSRARRTDVTRRIMAEVERLLALPDTGSPGEREARGS
jgi:1-acyl-sn-glycerol-3-phosphate acyltransferase